MNGLSAIELSDRLARVELLSLDTDGVLTDGGLYYTADGEELRKFNVKDGLGMKRVQAAGVKLCIVTASSTPAISARARVLGVDHVFLAAENKIGKIEGLCRDLGIGLDRVAHVGDDLNDLPLLEAVGCPLSVADATDSFRAAAIYVTTLGGGKGAVREICDMILTAKEAAA